jgi:7SK snRNA methylphosphate capping enzyme
MFEGKRCLDIGCNAGELTVTIARRYAPQHILGVDIDGSLVRFTPLPLLCLFAKTISLPNSPDFIQILLFRRARAHLAQVAKDASGSASAAREADAGQCDGGGVNPFVFPNNCGFRRENFVDTADADASYSVIMCLSTTKWIHFNWGDEGIKRLFKRVFNSLAPGGVFILEAQVKSPAQNTNHFLFRCSLNCPLFLHPPLPIVHLSNNHAAPLLSAFRVLQQEKAPPVAGSA